VIDPKIMHKRALWQGVSASGTLLSPVRGMDRHSLGSQKQKTIATIEIQRAKIA
jgi:hypothetical protein